MSVVHSIETDSGAHVNPDPLGNGDKNPQREADSSDPCFPKVRNTCKCMVTSTLYRTDMIFFLDWVHRLIFDEARLFGSRLCLCFQAKKVLTVVDPLDRAIISQWAR